MKKILALAVAAALGGYGYSLYKQQEPGLAQKNPLPPSVRTKCITKEGGVIYGTVPQGVVCERVEPVRGSLTVVPGDSRLSGGASASRSRSSGSSETMPEGSRFKCDGRIYCSQMTSCEEAFFFLENCPGVKMDGGGDGIPCERQWCN